MSIQEGLGKCCDGVKVIAVQIKDHSIQAGKWIGRTVVVIAGHIADFTKASAKAAQPHIIKAKDFVMTHKKYFIVGIICSAATLALYALFKRLCGNNDSRSVHAT